MLNTKSELLLSFIHPCAFLQQSSFKTLWFRRFPMPRVPWEAPDISLQLLPKSDTWVS